MRLMISKRASAIALGLPALLTLASPAMAQGVGNAVADKPWLGPSIAIFLAVCILLASLKDAKRSHRD